MDFSWWEHFYFDCPCFCRFSVRSATTFFPTTSPQLGPTVYFLFLFFQSAPLPYPPPPHVLFLPTQVELPKVLFTPTSCLWLLGSLTPLFTDRVFGHFSTNTLGTLVLLSLRSFSSAPTYTTPPPTPPPHPPPPPPPPPPALCILGRSCVTPFSTVTPFLHTFFNTPPFFRGIPSPGYALVSPLHLTKDFFLPSLFIIFLPGPIGSAL